MSRQRSLHWNGVYGQRNETEVSWFEPQPTCSVSLLEALGVRPAHSLIDIGAGAARLVDLLLRRGFVDLTVLDVSRTALRQAQRRLGPEADRVQWIVADLLAWQPGRQYDVWHDRAVFHFLVEADDRESYRRLLRQSLRVGGHLIVGTFAADGPDHCSGLPVARYDADQLTEAIGEGFVRILDQREDHQTPSGSVQPFTWVALRRQE